MLIESNYPALLLNADYTPISVFPLKTLTWKKALHGLFSEKLVRVADYDVEVSSVSQKFRIPSVVALRKYERVPDSVAFSRMNIWLRDQGKCVYCQECVTTDELTFDHVFPKSRGGDTSWENIACSCMPCNLRKANRTPKESKMFPTPVPRKPTQFELARAAKKLNKLTPVQSDWVSFIYWDSEIIQ